MSDADRSRWRRSSRIVWRWQERFMTAGVDRLLRDKSRPSRIPPLGAEIAERGVALTQAPMTFRADLQISSPICSRQTVGAGLKSPSSEEISALASAR